MADLRWNKNSGVSSTAHDWQKLGKYLTVSGSGSMTPMRSVGNNGIRESNWNINGRAEAKIYTDRFISDSLLRLNIGGHAYGGKVELPQNMQEYGEPAHIKYGGGAINNIGVGYTQGGFSADAGYNPNSKKRYLSAKYKINF